LQPSGNAVEPRGTIGPGAGGHEDRPHRHTGDQRLDGPRSVADRFGIDGRG
jgi:hypothetical protein